MLLLHSGGINNALPALANDVYAFISRAAGGRYVVRLGEALNRALHMAHSGREGYTETLEWAWLLLPEGARSVPVWTSSCSPLPMWEEF